MKYLNEYRKYSWSQANLITEDTEFFQYQFSQNTPNPLGPTHGFAVDPSVSIYTGQDSPYTDYYSRTIGLMNDLKSVIDYVNKDKKGIALQKFDYFVDDIDDYDNLKILRMFQNESNYLDIYISFDFKGEEYFGTYKNWNKPYMTPKLKCELYNSGQYQYINEEYKLKLSNFLRKILNNWFIPKQGLWRNLKEGCVLKDSMGSRIPLKSNIIINVKGYNIDENNSPYLIIEHKDKEYYLDDNNYYWFNWYFEKIK